MKQPASQPTAEDAAIAVLETVPPVMRSIRQQMRRTRPEGLSVPQFRAMIFIRRQPGSGLSELAEHLGATLPATSELVNRLVVAGFVSRTTNDRERRRIRLTLTPKGTAELSETEAATRARLCEVLTRLDARRLRRLVAAMGDLRMLTETETGKA